MIKNQLTNVKEYEFDNPPIQKIDFLIDQSIRDCHNKFFIHLIMCVHKFLILQILVILRQLISQFSIKLWVCMS